MCVPADEMTIGEFKMLPDGGGVVRGPGLVEQGTLGQVLVEVP
jgi:hypothetical protein